MKSLILNWTTAGWRFQNTSIFSKNFEEQWKLLQDVQIKNLDEYFNLDVAEGVWLDQVGELFGMSRDYKSLSGDQFTLDADQLDIPVIYLDGHSGALTDSLYRTLIKIKVDSSKKLFSMPNIRDNLIKILGEENIDVQFLENVDPYTGEYRPMYFQLKLLFKDAVQGKIFMSLLIGYPHLFDKPMGVSYDIICDFM